MTDQQSSYEANRLLVEGPLGVGWLVQQVGRLDWRVFEIDAMNRAKQEHVAFTRRGALKAARWYQRRAIRKHAAGIVARHLRGQVRD